MGAEHKYGRSFFEECWTIIETGGTVERQDFTAINRHPLSQAFVDHFLGLIGLHDRKQADYGREEDPFYNIRQSANWGVEPWVGALIRLDDKVGRLRNLIRNGGELQNESIEDSLDDIAVYAGIARVLLSESKSARSAQTSG